MDYRESMPKKRPFTAFPDVDAFFPAAAILQARQKVFRSLDRGEGVSLVFGDAGVGKTLLARLLAGQFEREAPVLAMTGFRFPDRQAFWSRLLYELNCDTSGNESDLRLRLLEYLRRSDYGRFFLLIDDAERLPLFIFDELRSILDLTSGNEVRVRIALFGTPSLEERLLHPKLARFTQRVVVREWLEPFNRTETERYIAARTAACQTTPFTREASRLVHRLCDGVPRLINQVADLALLLGPTFGKTPGMIDECVVQHSWESLQQISGGQHDEPAGGQMPAEPFPADSSAARNEENPPAASGVVEFGSLDDEQEGEQGDQSAGETAAAAADDAGLRFSDRIETPALSLSVYTDSETVRDGDGDAREPWDEEEPLDEEELDEEDGPIDPELERRLRERLARNTPRPGEDPLEHTLQCEPHGGEEQPPRREPSTEGIPPQSSAYLEQLRLLELEVEQEVALIRKIRDMQTGLSSFRLGRGEDQGTRRENEEDTTGGPLS